jgi:5-(carboxyamino)imidazole ribonucleotide synthase
MKVGVLGGGQLGRMLALAGYPLGLNFRFYDPAPDAPAEHVAEQWIGAFDDREKLALFADGVDVVTYEFENVPVESARFLAERVPVNPAPDALEAAQDRLREKTLFESLAIPTNRFAPVESARDIAPAIEHVGLPAVLKTRSLGYDGKGQWVIGAADDARRAVEAARGAALLLESFVQFERELSIVAVRSAGGETRAYELVQNRHQAGILRETRAPAPNLTRALQASAESYVVSALERFGYVGVLAIELFQVGEKLLANEMAPRVHNSGHWTIEGTAASQFENHLRAVCGLPLGSSASIGRSCMFNLIGQLPDVSSLLAVDGVHLHLYGKSPRPGRKLGHVTVWAETDDALVERIAHVRQIVEPS